MSNIPESDSDSDVVFLGHCPARSRLGTSSDGAPTSTQPTVTRASARATVRNFLPSTQVDATLINAPIVRRTPESTPPRPPLPTFGNATRNPPCSPNELPPDYFAEFDETMADTNPPLHLINPNRHLWPVPPDQWVWNDEMTESWLPQERESAYQYPIYQPQPYRLLPNYPRTAFPGGIDHHTQALWIDDAVIPMARTFPPMQTFQYFNPDETIRFKAHLACSPCDSCGTLTRDPFDLCTLCLRTTKNLMICPHVHNGTVMNGLFANKIEGTEGTTIFRPTRPAPLSRLTAHDIPGDIILSLNQLEIIDPQMLADRYGPSLGVYVWNNSTPGQDGTFLDGAINRVAASYVNACDPGQVPNCAFQFDPHRGHYLRCINRCIRQGDALVASYDDQGRWREMHDAGWRFNTYHGW